jgi:hypothetical protein
MVVVVELYKEKKQNGRDPCLGHYPRSRVPRFYVQIVDTDLNPLPVPFAMEPVLVEKLKIKKLLVKMPIMTCSGSTAGSASPRVVRNSPRISRCL